MGTIARSGTFIRLHVERKLRPNARGGCRRRRAVTMHAKRTPVPAIENQENL